MPSRYSHTVVMGDLVSSERSPSVRHLHGVFNGVIDRANEQDQRKLVSPLTITLGDEFQGLCANLSDGLVLVRKLRASMLLDRLECRFVLGVISLETPVNNNRAWNMMGPGLAASRKRLADKRDGNAYRFVLPDQPTIQILMDGVGAALTDIERDWTDRQRQVILLSEREAVGDVVTRLGMSPATYYKIRRAGRFELYENEWRALTESVVALDRSYGFI